MMMNDDSIDRFFHWIVQKAIRQKERIIVDGNMNYLIMTSVEFY